MRKGTHHRPESLSLLSGSKRAYWETRREFPEVLEAPGVYRIVNTLDGKVYIGSSSRCRRRLRQHRWLLDAGRHTNGHLQGAWKKYGEAAFRFEVIEYIPSALIGELTDFEQGWIDATRAWDSAYGYNLARFAETVGRGRVVSEESRRRMSEAHKGKKSSEESRRRVSEALRGRTKASSHVQKVADALRGRKQPADAIRKRQESRWGKAA